MLRKWTMRSCTGLLLGAMASWAVGQAGGQAAPELPAFQFDLPGEGKALAGDTFQVNIPIPEGWHITSHKPESEFQVPLEVTLKAEGLKFATPIYPEPKLTYMEALGFNGSWFEKNLTIKIPVAEVASGVQAWPGIYLEVYSQACTDKMCLPPRTDSVRFGADALNRVFSAPKVAPGSKVFDPASGAVDANGAGSAEAKLATSVAPSQDSVASASSVAPQDSSLMTLLTFLLFAFVGGMILNLMPCVLPVLGIKVFSLVQKRGEKRGELLAHAGVFTLGTLVSFWILAGAMIVLKHMGQAVGWGFQFQEPGYVVFMAVLVALFALNLFGLFEVSLGWKAQTQLDSATRKEGWAGAFFNGAFMTLLATPCTAPMLSPAMGFAFSQPEWVLVVFMSAVALGLAAPYALVCFFPGALKYFPKPGPWMMRFKEFMGFLLLFTLVWLLYVFGQQAGNYALAVLVALLMVVALFVWMWSHLPWTTGFEAKPLPKLATLTVMLGLFGYGVQAQLLPAMAEFKAERIAAMDAAKNGKQENPDNPYRALWTPAKVQELNAKGKDVFVDFTADWCISCKANEKVALAPEQVDRHFRAGEPVLLIGDYTHQDPAITAELKRFGRSGVPMYVLYRADGTTEVLPELITPQIVLKAIGK